VANPEHVEILKRGVTVWKEWRVKRTGERLDLSASDLSNLKLNKISLKNADLSGANLQGTSLCAAKLDHADLSNANLSGSDMKNAVLRGANLTDTNLAGADVCSAHFDGANLLRADLSKARMRFTQLQDADLRHAALSHADLHNAFLEHANLSFAEIDVANFHGAVFGGTFLIDIDLSRAHNLKNAEHRSSSEVSISTLIKSSGRIPAEFLRGCGLSDWQIESAKLHRPNLSNDEVTNITYRIYDFLAHQAIQINPLFISYNHTDTAFVDAMERHLNDRGIRFWRDIHDATAGRLETQIDRAIRLNPTVVLVLSEQSVKSDWVEHEAWLARKLEQETGRDVLCPVALDDRWKTGRWPERLREQIMEYNILDFSEWRDEDKFRRMFSRLLDGLDLFYK
jgi:uncharacterized protein YjbI with pentapeptide repeats